MSRSSIRTRHVPTQTLATLTFHVLVEDLPLTIANGLTELARQLQGQHATANAEPFVIYHSQVNVDSDGPIEICQPYIGAMVPAGAVVLREELAHEEAFVGIPDEQASFLSLLTAYDALSAYIQRHGQYGPLNCREIYARNGNTTGDRDRARQVAWPYLPGDQP